MASAALDMSKDRKLCAELEWWNKLTNGMQHHSGFLAMCTGESDWLGGPCPLSSAPCESWHCCMLAALDLQVWDVLVGLDPALLPQHGHNGIQKMVWGNIGICALGQMSLDQKEWLVVLEQHVKTVATLKRPTQMSWPTSTSKKI